MLGEQVMLQGRYGLLLCNFGQGTRYFPFIVFAPDVKRLAGAIFRFKMVLFVVKKNVVQLVIAVNNNVSRK